MDRLRSLDLLSTLLCVLLAAGYLTVDGFFLYISPIVTFLVAENLFWMVLYIVSAYLTFSRSKYRVLTVAVAGVNAGRVSRSIVDPYGLLGTTMLPVHASLFALLVLTAVTVALSYVLQDSRTDLG